MVEDIAATQDGYSVTIIDSLPPSRAYVIRAALRHIENADIKSDTWDGSKRQLEISLREFDGRWGVGA